MKTKISKQTITIATFLVVIFLLFAGFAVRNGPFTDLDLSKDAPPVRTTHDAFYHSWVTKATSDQEDTRTWPGYLTQGVDSEWFQPPMLYVFASSFGKLTSMPTYQLFFVLMCLLGILIPLQIFVLFKKWFGTKTGIIGMALALFPTYNWLMFYVLGYYMDFLAFAVVPLGLFFTYQYFKTNTWGYGIGLGLIFGFSFLSHPFEAFFAGLNLLLVGIVLLVLRKWSFKHSIKLALWFILGFIIITAYYLPFFIEGYGAGGSAVSSYLSILGTPSSIPSYFWPATFHWFILGGIALSLIVLIMQYKKIIKDSNKLMLIIFIIIGAAFLLMLQAGFEGNRVMRYHFLFYNFIAFIPGIGIAALLKNIKHKLIHDGLILGGVVVLAILFMIPTYTQINNVNKNSMFTDDKWEAIRYIKDNTPEDSSIFYLYGYFHNFQAFSQRLSFNVDFGREYTTETYQTLCSGTMPEEYKGMFETLSYYKERSKLAVGRNSLFDFKAIDRPSEAITTKPLESFDYVVTQYTGTQIQPCIQFFAQNMVDRGYPVVYNNPTMLIFKVTT